MRLPKRILRGWPFHRRRVHDPRWPVFAALVTAWTLPATTTRRITNVGHKTLLRFHLAVLLGAGVLLVALGLVNRYAREDSWGHLLIDVPAEVAMMAMNITVDPDVKAYAVARFVLTVEVVLLVLAILAVPFTARNESLRDSWNHALARTWLQSSQLLPLLCLVGGAWIAGWTLESRWPHHVERQFERIDPAPAFLATRIRGEGPLVYAQGMMKRKRDEDRRAFTAWKKRPWYVAHAREFRLYVALLGGAWFLWALLRGGSAPRPLRALEQPPRCRRCGYVIIGIAPDGRCPECSVPVADSLAPEASAGTPWDTPRSLLGVWTYARTLVAFILAPRRCAGRLLFVPDPRRSCKFLAITALLSAGAFGGLFAYTSRQFIWPGALLRVVPIAALIAGAVVVTVASLTAHLVALRLRQRDGRDVLAASAQVSAYCSGCLLLLAIVAGCLVEMWPQAVARMAAVSSSTGWTMTYVRTLAIVITALIVLALYYLVVYRTAQGVRHAFRTN